MQTVISPTPYTSVVGQQFGELTIQITNKQFAGVSYQPGKTALVFKDCIFEKIIIENPDSIDFGGNDFSLSFFNCYIGTLEIKELATDNMDLSAYASILYMVIDNKLIKSMELNNCILTNRLFLTNVKSVRIAFTKENFNDKQWDILINKVRGLKREELWGSNQTYYLNNCKNLSVSSNFEDGKKWPLNLNIDIRYPIDSEDNITRIQDLALKSMVINGQSKGKIEVRKVLIDKWYITDFSTEKEAFFYDIKPAAGAKSKLLGITGCKLNNVSFNAVQFDRYDTLGIFVSNFTGCKFTSCNFSRNYKHFQPLANVHYPDRVTENASNDRYEMLLQLKGAMEDVGNYYEVQRFQVV